ncbi:MAG: MltA domain-containing protein [Oligoflexia bacterium]|nr:MltA domain-containing protein [Oligoflexia bacterium]
MRPAQHAPRLITDDLNFEGLQAALTVQQQAFSKRDPDTLLQFGPRTIRLGDYLRAVNTLLALDTTQLAAALNRDFEFFEVFGDQRWGDIFLTSYFEPVISGSSQPTPRFTRALYRKPPDLLALDLAKFMPQQEFSRKFRARLAGSALLPYYSREEIDSRGALNGRGLEICWVDPIDAFFLQVQGSGVVSIDGKQDLKLNFADKNGHEYQAIGKFVKEKIAPRQVDLPSLEAYLRSLSPAEAQRIMNLNPSYVFFEPGVSNARTASGLPATAGRTIATDHRLFPKGALGLLEFDKPVLEAGSDRQLGTQRVSRLVLDQDTGGAITGPGRVDLFWGRGEEAKRYAGIIKGRGRLYYLVPKV